MSKISAPSVLPDIFSGDTGVKKDSKVFPLYNVCFLGHVDAGKSTTVSRILFDSGAVDKHLLDQFEREAIALGKETFKFAFLMDKQAEERKRGITIDLGCAEWATENRYYTIIDAPGHKDFTKNAIVGASQADLIVLVVDSKKGLLEAGTTEEHAIIARGSGVSSVVVALTKIDTIPLESRMSTIKEREGEVKELLLRCGYPSSNTIIVPVDSYNGVNIKDKSSNAEMLPGYEGMSLIEALDKVPLELHDETLPFRLSVSGTCNKIGGTNCVLTGKVISGKVSPNDTVIVKPSNKVGRVGSIQMHHKTVSYATAGANVGIDVKGITEADVDKASILCHKDDRPVKAVQEFTIEKAVLKSHPSALTLNSKIIVHYQTGCVSAKVKSLSNVFNIAQRTQSTGPVEQVAPGSLVDIVLVPDKDICVEPKSLHPRNSRVLLRESNKTIGWGSVSAVVPSRFQI